VRLSSRACLTDVHSAGSIRLPYVAARRWHPARAAAAQHRRCNRASRGGAHTNLIPGLLRSWASQSQSLGRAALGGRTMSAISAAATVTRGLQLSDEIDTHRQFAQDAYCIINDFTHDGQCTTRHALRQRSKPERPRPQSSVHESAAAPEAAGAQTKRPRTVRATEAGSANQRFPRRPLQSGRPFFTSN
jgi:hypothetical protein